MLAVARICDQLAEPCQELGPGRDGAVVAKVRKVRVHTEDHEDRQCEEHVLQPLGKRFSHGSDLTQGFAPTVLVIHEILRCLLIGGRSRLLHPPMESLQSVGPTAGADHTRMRISCVVL